MLFVVVQSRRKVREPQEENVTLGPAVRDGEHVFGVARIFASFNDTFIVSICISFISHFQLSIAEVSWLIFMIAACH